MIARSDSIRFIKPTVLATLGLALCLHIATSTAFALSPALKQGMDEYNQGDYKAAEGHLGQALAQDFDNAVLHYYLANTYVHLNKKNDAIKEFRIAYAMEPQKEVGKLSKVALGYLGAEGDGEEKKTRAAEVPKTPPKPINPNLDKAVSTLNDEVKKERERNQRTASELANEASRRASTIVSSKKQDILDGLKYYRRGMPYQMPIPPDVLQQLDGLRSMYDQQSASHLENASRRSAELQKTADNLQSLLSDKNAKPGAKLSPVGTNLYIRNYQGASKSDSASDKPTAGKPGTPAAVANSAATSAATTGATAATGASTTPTAKAVTGRQ